MKGAVFLDLTITANDELVRNVKAGGILDSREKGSFVILKTGNRDVIDFQGSFFPSFAMVHPNMWKIKQR